ncbi:MAG: hypothetical protein LBD78_04535 [Spirochaetaceae bacterium]|jgi:hypothetical protein|nr:hypothetical protein [Spirochaetaceae bacterium]
MKCPHCGKEVNVEAEVARLKKNERLTSEEKAKNKAYYSKLEVDGHKNKVKKVKLGEKDYEKMVPEKAALLKGRQVFSCEQEYQAPADEQRAKKGLETPLITAVRAWMEVDGEKIHTNATAEEIRKLLKSKVPAKPAPKHKVPARPAPARSTAMACQPAK